MLFADLDIDRLVPLPYQCRGSVEGPEFEELVESIRHFGVLEPILVRGKPDLKFEVIYGGRRVAAARKAGLKKVPANIRVLNDQTAYEINFTENIQRKDLSDLEKARMLDFLIKKFNYTQQQIAQKFGKTQGWVSQHLSMLQIPESITAVIKHGELKESQAREILSAPKDKQEKIIDEINRSGEVPSAQKLHEIVHPESKDLSDGKLREILESPRAQEMLAETKKGGPLFADRIETAGKKKESLAEESSTEEAEAEEAVTEGQFKPDSKRLDSQPVLEVTCPDCHKLLIVRHFPNGKHTIVLGKEEQ